MMLLYSERLQLSEWFLYHNGKGTPLKNCNNTPVTSCSFSGKSSFICKSFDSLIVIQRHIINISGLEIMLTRLKLVHVKFLMLKAPDHFLL